MLAGFEEAEGVTKYSKDMQEGFEVQLDKLPSKLSDSSTVSRRIE